jgi:hypothetical protein
MILTGVAVSQTIVESAVSAAGGTAAGVAGRKVGQGIESVFGKVGGATKAAAETGAKRDDLHRLAAPIPPLPPIPGTADAAPPPARTGARRQAAAVTPSSKPLKSAITGGAGAAEASTELPVQAVGEPAPQPEAVRTPPPPPRNLNELPGGSSREEVLGKWGKPAGRLTMSNDEGFVEVYKYPEGTVRIVNGKLTEIRPNQP